MAGGGTITARLLVSQLGLVRFCRPLNHAAFRLSDGFVLLRVLILSPPTGRTRTDAAGAVLAPGFMNIDKQLSVSPVTVEHIRTRNLRQDLDDVPQLVGRRRKRWALRRKHREEVGRCARPSSRLRRVSKLRHYP